MNLSFVSSPSTCDGEVAVAQQLTEGISDIDGRTASAAPPSRLRRDTSPSQVDGEEENT